MVKQFKAGIIINFFLFALLFVFAAAVFWFVADKALAVILVSIAFVVVGLAISIIFYSQYKAISRQKSCIDRDKIYGLLDSVKVLASLSVLFIEDHDAIIDLFEKYSNGDIPHKIESLEKNKAAIETLGKRAEELQNEVMLENDYEAKIAKLLDMIKDIDSSLWSNQVQIKQDLKHFDNSIEKIFSFNSRIIGNSARILYNLRTSIPLLSRLTQKSNEYTTAIMKDVLASFEHISGNTNQISDQTEITINLFMDGNDQSSLAFVSEKMKEIVEQFENFSSTITSLEDVSGNLLSDSLHSLFDIEETAKSIETLAEKIKLISINVRIEAARLGSDQKGFKVIGNEISDFADKTSKIAKETYGRISETIESIDKIRDNYIASMDRVFDYVKNIENKIQPFNEIITSSFERIRLIISSLNDFSREIDKQLKMTIGNFQHYDVVTQESDHIIRYLVDIQDYFNQQISSGKMNIENRLTEADKKEIQNFIYEKFNVLAATENEQAILKEFIAQYHIKPAVSKTSEAEKQIKNTEDGVVLF